MKSQGKLVAIVTVAVGLLVLVASGFAAKEWILEKWYIHELETRAQAEKNLAAMRLGEMASVRSVPILLKVMKQECHSPSFTKRGFTQVGNVQEEQFPGTVPFCRDALVKIGKPAIPPLIKAMEDQNEHFGCVAAVILGRIIFTFQPPLVPGWTEHVNEEIILEELREDGAQSQEVHQAAAEALKKIQETQDETER